MKTVHLILDVSPLLNEKLESLAARIHSNKSDLLRKAIALLEVAVAAKESGDRFGVADRNQRLKVEIVGL